MIRRGSGDEPIWQHIDLVKRSQSFFRVSPTLGVDSMSSRSAIQPRERRLAVVKPVRIETEPIFETSWLEVNLGGLDHHLAAFRRVVQPPQHSGSPMPLICGVIKSDAYGTGHGPGCPAAGLAWLGHSRPSNWCQER